MSNSSIRNLTFFKRYLKALSVSALARHNTMRIIKRLLYCDPLQITKFELSFKVRNGAIEKCVRFLNMDGNAYSCRDPYFFLGRVEAYRRIIGNTNRNPLLNELFKVLSRVSSTPMNLYFGSDIRHDSHIFAFWLIFGGIDRKGETHFWPYDFSKIINRSLRVLSLKKPDVLEKDILNLGFDIDDSNIFYKLYYLCKPKYYKRSEFASLIKRLNVGLAGNKFFYFYSHMYNKDGQCIKKKLFLEFLEDIYPKNEVFERILTKVLKASGNERSFLCVNRFFKAINGRFCLVSFEKDRTLTFYVRRQ